MLHLHVDRKWRQTRRGFTLHYCFLCRGITIHRVERSDLRTQVNMVAVGRAIRSRGLCHCLNCGRGKVVPFEYMEALPIGRRADAVDLKRQLHPAHLDLLNHQAEFRGQVPGVSLSDRDARIYEGMEILHTLDYSVEVAARGRSIPAVLMLLFIMGIAASSGVLMVMLLSPKTDPHWPWAALMLVAMVAGCVTVGWLTRTRAWARRRVLPVVAREFRSLDADPLLVRDIYAVSADLAPHLVEYVPAGEVLAALEQVAARGQH